MKYLDQVAAVKLTAAKLMRAHELADAKRADALAAGEAPDFISLMVALVQAVPQEFSREEVPAIVFRMQALAALLKTADLTGWASEDQADEGAWFVNEAVLGAAAVARLDLSGEPAFDADEFRGLALKIADPEGQA